jgi:hypothetical protein
MAAALIGAIILFLLFRPPSEKVAEPSFSKAEEDSPPVA